MQGDVGYANVIYSSEVTNLSGPSLEFGFCCGTIEELSGHITFVTVYLKTEHTNARL